MLRWVIEDPLTDTHVPGASATALVLDSSMEILSVLSDIIEVYLEKFKILLNMLLIGTGQSRWMLQQWSSN